MDYNKIYETLKDSSQYNLNGLTTLNLVKRKCKCNTEDILIAAKLNQCKEIGNCISHTTIFDFGITSDNIKKSAKKDNLNNHLRGIT